MEKTDPKQYFEAIKLLTKFKNKNMLTAEEAKQYFEAIGLLAKFENKEPEEK